MTLGVHCHVRNGVGIRGCSRSWSDGNLGNVEGACNGLSQMGYSKSWLTPGNARGGRSCHCGTNRGYCGRYNCPRLGSYGMMVWICR